MNVASLGVEEIGDCEIITHINPGNEAIGSGKEDGTLVFDNKRRNLGRSNKDECL